MQSAGLRRSRKSPLICLSKDTDPPTHSPVPVPSSWVGPLFLPLQANLATGWRRPPPPAPTLSSQDATQRWASQAAQSSTPGRRCLSPTCCSCRSAPQSCPLAYSGARQAHAPPRLVPGLGMHRQGRSEGQPAPEPQIPSVWRLAHLVPTRRLGAPSPQRHPSRKPEVPGGRSPRRDQVLWVKGPDWPGMRVCLSGRGKQWSCGGSTLRPACAPCPRPTGPGRPVPGLEQSPLRPEPPPHQSCRSSTAAPRTAKAAGVGPWPRPTVCGLVSRSGKKVAPTGLPPRAGQERDWLSQSKQSVRKRLSLLQTQFWNHSSPTPFFCPPPLDF